MILPTTKMLQAAFKKQNTPPIFRMTLAEGVWIFNRTIISRKAAA
jgi:hypothetical protein